MLRRPKTRNALPAMAACAVAVLCAVVLAHAQRVAVPAAGLGALSGLSIEHAERALQPGEVVLFTIRAGEPLARASVAGLGGTWQTFPGPVPGVLMALAGIDLAVKPGTAVFAVDAQAVSGGRRAGSVTLHIAPKVFPTRRLTVDPSFVTPPKSALPRIQRESERVAAIFAAVSGERLWGERFVKPVPGDLISRFGVRSIFNGESRGSHRGADFAGASGTPVAAPAGGRVVLVDELYYSGQTVVIDHGLGVFSLLCHLSRTDVPPGAIVAAGDLVGAVGATGRVTGPHLHWTARIGPASVDPASLMVAIFPR
jgi:hypothetical protein